MQKHRRYPNLGAKRRASVRDRHPHDHIFGDLSEITVAEDVNDSRWGRDWLDSHSFSSGQQGRPRSQRSCSKLQQLAQTWILLGKGWYTVRSWAFASPRIHWSWLRDNGFPLSEIPARQLTSRLACQSSTWISAWVSRSVSECCRPKMRATPRGIPQIVREAMTTWTGLTDVLFHRIHESIHKRSDEIRIGVLTTHIAQRSQMQVFTLWTETICRPVMSIDVTIFLLTDRRHFKWTSSSNRVRKGDVYHSPL